MCSGGSVTFLKIKTISANSNRLHTVERTNSLRTLTMTDNMDNCSSNLDDMDPNSILVEHTPPGLFVAYTFANANDRFLPM